MPYKRSERKASSVDNHARRRVRNRQPARQFERRQSARWMNPASFTFVSIRREEALFLIRRYLEVLHSFSKALRLIELFQIEPEELTEVGVRFETLKAFERRYPLVRSFQGLMYDV